MQRLTNKDVSVAGQALCHTNQLPCYCLLCGVLCVTACCVGLPVDTSRHCSRGPSEAQHHRMLCCSTSWHSRTSCRHFVSVCTKEDELAQPACHSSTVLLGAAACCTSLALIQPFHPPPLPALPAMQVLELADDTVALRSLDHKRDRFDIEFALQASCTMQAKAGATAGAAQGAPAQKWGMHLKGPALLRQWIAATTAVHAAQGAIRLYMSSTVAWWRHSLLQRASANSCRPL